MNEEILVRVNKYSNKIKELNVIKRIETNFPILVRQTVSKKLAKAAKKLPKGLSLQIDGGYRSPQVQKFLWDYRVKQLGLKKAKRLVGNPNIGIPGHTTGGAVDVSLLDKDSTEINLSAPFTKYYDEQQLFSEKITEEAQKLRLLLYKAMLSVGFAPHNEEYWHFSYGDGRWAKYYNKNVVYDQVENPKPYYYPVLLRFLYKLNRRIYKIRNRILKVKINY